MRTALLLLFLATPGPVSVPYLRFADLISTVLCYSAPVLLSAGAFLDNALVLFLVEFRAFLRHHRYTGTLPIVMTKTGVNEVLSKGGFSFDLCRRNAMLQQQGAKLPKYRKTGTTIVGLIFKVCFREFWWWGSVFGVVEAWVFDGVLGW